MTHSLDNNIIPFLAVIITYFGLLTYIGYYATKQTREPFISTILQLPSVR